MAEPRIVDPGEVLMTGENSFIRLSNDGGKTVASRVSHWRVLWCPAGQGHALFMETPLEKGVRLYADNPGVARWLQRTIEVYLHKPFADESLPVVDADFTRSGDALSTVHESVVSSKGEIVMSWWDLIEPFILTVPPGAMDRPIGVYSTFLPAKSAQLLVDGQAAPGKPFPMERGGRQASSCCLAWSESWTKPK